MATFRFLFSSLHVKRTKCPSKPNEAQGRARSGKRFFLTGMKIIG